MRRRVVLPLVVLLGAALAAAALRGRPDAQDDVGAAIEARAAACLPTTPPVAGGDAPPTPRAGRLLVANPSARTATVVDLATGTATRIALDLRDPHEAAVSPDGRWGVVTDFGARGAMRRVRGQEVWDFDGRRLAVIDLAAARVARVIDVGAHRGLHDVAFVPGAPGRVVVTAQTSRTVADVDLAAGAVAGTLRTDAAGSHLLAVTGDGRTVFTVDEIDGTVTRLDRATGARAWQRAVGAPPVEGIGVTPDGRTVLVGSLRDGTVRLLDGATGAVRATVAGFATPVRIAVSPDGRRALVADARCGAAHVLDVAAARVEATIGGLGQPTGVEIAADGRTAFVTLGDRDAAAVRDLAAGRVVARHAAGRGPDGVGWGPAAAALTAPGAAR
ncbi:PQQ-binding-like beta-propeller repeat protein [Roseisolibacter sp. H3M3-2]|uniref:YncE family protein n=1 Tax=Roseisolibacter sp. H3M3-2 TaxID=3031323 RepID=UPI0023DBA4CA|nr:PQQ-binding-like beta-propeller repeat protein [Roseisolibacter sp. H3M3-2]MDF1504571.1 PQQ-binding-like beta-propeller repeat protein [Roseisolibacter sp. H3M3-2]